MIDDEGFIRKIEKPVCESDCGFKGHRNETCRSLETIEGIGGENVIENGESER